MEFSTQVNIRDNVLLELVPCSWVGRLTMEPKILVGKPGYTGFLLCTTLLFRTANEV